MKLYLSAAAGGMGVLVTLLWVPELSTLDLAESRSSAGPRCAAVRRAIHGNGVCCVGCGPVSRRDVQVREAVGRTAELHLAGIARLCCKGQRTIAACSGWLSRWR